MLEVTQLRNGMYFEEDGTPFKVLSYDHIKVGRGGATVKIKVKNLLTGSFTIRSYQSGKRVEEADIETVRATYKYRTADYFIFDTDEDEVEIAIEKIEEEGKYLKKEMSIELLMYQCDPITISLPIKVGYQVKEAPPDARGNSANASTKEVVLENNLKVKTPMFIKENDTVIVDTRTGDYVERA